MIPVDLNHLSTESAPLNVCKVDNKTNIIIDVRNNTGTYFPFT